MRLLTSGRGRQPTGVVNPQRIYFQQNANKNVTSLTDASGNVLERYIYDPYGNVTVPNPDGTVRGDGTIASSSYKVPNRFQGMRLDAPTGNYTTPNREYDPMLGTWEEADPALYVDGADAYEAFLDNPSVLVDPAGTSAAGGSGAGAFQKAAIAARSLQAARLAKSNSIVGFVYEVEGYTADGN